MRSFIRVSLLKKKKSDSPKSYAERATWSELGNLRQAQRHAFQKEGQKSK
jgi:hypothetical protein